jgi:hypothetical protein
MQRDDLVTKIRSRVEQCRRLALSTTDEHTARVLNEMAKEGEADIARLLRENNSSLGASDLSS